MKTFNSVYVTFILGVFISSFLLTGCDSENLYDPNYRGVNPMEGIQVPDNFDWNSTYTANIHVIAGDKYNGKYNYEVGIYDENPLYNDKAVAITKGLMCQGSDFDASVDLLKQNNDSTILYCCQSMKMKNGTTKKTVKALYVENNKKEIVCNFGNSQVTNSVKNIPQRRALYKIETKENVPNNAIVISGNGKVSLKANNIYVIKKGTTFNGTVEWADCRNIKIYVEGTFNPQNPTLQLNNAAELYILGSGKSQLNDLELNSGAKLFNEGSLTIIGDLYATNANTIIFNEGRLIISGKTRIDSGTQLYNNCYFKVEELSVDGIGTFMLGGGSLFISSKMNARANNIIALEQDAILEITGEANFSYNNIITGRDNSGNHPALVKIKSITADWEGITFENGLQVVITEPFKLSEHIRTDGSVSFFDENDDAYEVEATKCNEGGNNVEEPDEPEGSDYPIEVPESKKYTIVMEDNWPMYGDYDMNDIVMDVESSYTVARKNQVFSLDIEVTLRAAGAINVLSGGIQLDKISADKVKYATISDYKREMDFGIKVFDLKPNGIEKGQRLAVIPLFNNAFVAMSNSLDGMINTSHVGGTTANETKIVTTIYFNSSSAVTPKDVSINKLNFFIVTDAQSSNRKEVHLAGYNPTDKANTQLFGGNDDNSKRVPYLSKENLPWGLMIPYANKNDKFRYPLETKNIETAYHQFRKWAESAGEEAKYWYYRKNANSENIY